MWQVPNQKLRAMMNARKREKDKHKKSFHIRRAYAQIKIVSTMEAPPLSDVRVILNDISPKMMNIFSAHPLPTGQVCAVTLEEPKRIYVRARIVGCQELDAESHVISTQPFSYRVHLLFLFNDESEEKAFKSYCDQLATEVLGTVKTA